MKLWTHSKEWEAFQPAYAWAGIGEPVGETIREAGWRKPPEPEEKENSMPLNIELTENSRAGATTLLNALLADESVLAVKTRNCHWNVVGPHFHDLHQLFASQYGTLDEMIDDVAERARALGGHAVGTLVEFLKLARLKEQPDKYPNATLMTANLLADHEALVRQLRRDLQQCADKFGDAGTADFLTSLMGRHEKMSWMLRAVLEGKNEGAIDNQGNLRKRKQT